MEKKIMTEPFPKKTSTAPLPIAPAPIAPPPVKHVEKHEIKKWCTDQKYRYVLVQTRDGWCCDGFIEHIDDETLCIAIPHCGPNYDPRGFVPFTPFNPFFPAPFFPGPFFPRRRFIRQTFPIAALLGLSLLPFF
ncbi:hypothetical protein PAECIP111893_03782 [Paenibacillus plantiphilus]|uniref:Uncharacterized protein n=1 Tax=Paenibacillus plantiphilus TaxID=2905650 RepID=A0ABM9CJ52_9BACL|nr:hypothetical protein [Paenibacillus plantiphilus]CAH1214153.1 hypothetical protein PAECIP111893_03782 [Paenibacillus plantiphilus]